MIDRLPATMLMMFAGTKNGEILRGPRPDRRRIRSRYPSPPMPEPIATPDAFGIWLRDLDPAVL